MLQKASELDCPICKSKAVTKWNAIYSECQSCGHHFNENLIPPEMVNENLELIERKKSDSLERFKRAVLQNVMQENELLIDYGSGSGKFLDLNKDLFKKVIGIETSKPCVDFSVNSLKLQIHQTTQGLSAPSVLSFWHSLEHLRVEQAASVFSDLLQGSTAQMRVIVSVPRGDSLLHRILKENDPYYDPMTHFQEFSRKSLLVFLGDCGLAIDKNFFSFSYSIFGWAQGLSNLFHPQRNYFYNRFRRSQSAANIVVDLQALFLFAFFLPVSCFFALTELLGVIGASVVTVSAKKRSQ